jgi:hypothetical protein
MGEELSRLLVTGFV